MDKLFTFALAIAVSLGTTVLLANGDPAARLRQNADWQMAADGAFRDGLYVGRLAAEGGRPLQPQIGRWSSDRDRTSFVAGYRRGYNDVLISATRGRQNRPE
ncbi:MAG: hypothetical protein WCA27_00245 [Candidatus Sulfotelmatobacter sp.]